MGRKRNWRIREYFDGEGNRHGKCKACGEMILQNFTTNLKRHLRTKHYELFQEYEKRIKLENVTTDVNDKKIKFTSEMSPNEIVNACIDFITKDALPLSFFDSDAFKTLTRHIFDGLKIPKITSQNIMQFADEKCIRLKVLIKTMMRGKLLCLKIDTATRSNRRVLCIDAQIFMKKKIQIVTLSMEEIKGRPTAANIKSSIEKVMHSYEIRHEQVYAVTSDNARNLIKAVELLSEAVTDDDEQDIMDITASTEFSGDVLKPVIGEHIISIKCAAHTLQLAVNEFLHKYSPGIISRAREVVKLLRTPSFRLQIKDLGFVKPQLDSSIRWSSTYNMLNRLLQLKDFCINHLTESDHLSNEEWELVDNIILVLLPLHTLTLKLQGSQLLLGDFYKSWLEMIFQLKNIGSSMSKKLLYCIREKQDVLLQNDTMNAALFLDPRLRRMLSNEMIESAKNHLKGLVRRMESLKEYCHTKVEDAQEDHRIEPAAFPIDESSMQNSSALLRSSIRELELANSSSEEECFEFRDEIRKAFFEIDTYKEKRIDIDADLIEYWNGKKYSFPWLRKLAFAVHSVPATQVSVERAFSALKLILTDLRYNLSEKNMETICLLKLNNTMVSYM